MSALPTLGYQPDPGYGHGACVRRIILKGTDGRVDATLADEFHEFACTLLHNGNIVTKISGRGIRMPTSICSGSTSLLEELVGISLDTAGSAFYGHDRARRHCTHLYDLAILTIAHGRRGRERRTYEAIVPDETDAPVSLKVKANGEVIHNWTVQDGRILEPAALVGLPMGRGMAAWASRRFAQDELEAAIILARTWLIAVGRRFRVDDAIGHPITLNSALSGSCFAYDPTRADTAVFTASRISI